MTTSDFGACKNCGEYCFLSQHNCAPEWQAIYIGWDNEETPEKAFGGDAGIAAEKYIERHFWDWDYPEEAEIWIRKSDQDKWQKFNVEVQQVPEFTATEIIKE